MTNNTAAPRHRRITTIALLVLFLLYFAGTSLLSPPSAQSSVDTTGTEPVQAAPAEAFVDSIGVVTHLHYTDTVYNKFDTLVRPRLSELGVRHVADAAYTHSAASRSHFFYKRLRLLGQAGIKFNLGVTMNTLTAKGTDVEKLDDIQSWTDGAVELFEGVNEPDITGIADWASRAIGMQQAVSQKVQSDPALRDVDVIAPSPVWKPLALGDISQWTDYTNWHAYPGGRCGTCPDVYGQSFDTRVPTYRSPASSKPLMITETGYHNTTVTGEHRPASERAAGKYIPRMLFEYFNRDVARTYLYELIDVRKAPTKRDANFGLLRNDGSRKPAFVALRNTIQLLNEEPGAAFTPDSLDFRLEGQTAKVHHTLLQKRDGTFYLALWQERSSYDNGQRANSADALTRRDLVNPDQTVTVSMGRTFPKVELYRPGAGTTAQRAWNNTARVTFAVPDEVVLLSLGN